MLPRQNRLKLPTNWKKSKPDFSAYNPYFKAIAKKINNQTEPKIGFIISSKVGKATVRNGLRRLLARSARSHLAAVANEWQVVFILSPKAREASNEEIVSEVNKVLSKLSLARQSTN